MVIIKEVTTKSELKKFVDYPNVLYSDNPCYIPHLYGDDLEDWNPKKNPAFDYCRAKCFLAYRGGNIVGRIGAIFSAKANEKYANKHMRFTCVDFIDDEEVSNALFAAVEGFAAECGCTKVHGPLGFTDLDSEGMLVEGFDQKAQFFTYYNHPYYHEHMARLGYVKDVDWVEYRLEVPNTPLDKLDKMADFVIRNHKLHVLDIKRHQVGQVIERVFKLVNEAYSVLYGTVPLSDEQVKRYAKKFIPLINFDYTCFVENEKNELVAFGVTAPSMADALKKSRGRLFPFGAFRVLRALKHNDTLDMFLVAVRPDLQGTGINAILLNKVLKNAVKNGIKYAETGPMLEHNIKVQAQWKFFDKTQHKRRRCYVKALNA